MLVLSTATNPRESIRRRLGIESFVFAGATGRMGEKNRLAVNKEVLRTLQAPPLFSVLIRVEPAPDTVILGFFNQMTWKKLEAEADKEGLGEHLASITKPYEKIDDANRIVIPDLFASKLPFQKGDEVVFEGTSIYYRVWPTRLNLDKMPKLSLYFEY